MTKTYEVDPSLFFARRSYVTGYRRSEEARQRAEQQLELDRSGENRRRELAEQARRLQAELRSLGKQVAWAGQSDATLRPALGRLPSEAPALERWIAQATVLKQAVAAELPAMLEAQRERERQRRLAEERARQARLQQDIPQVRQVLAWLKEGCYVASYAVDEAYGMAVSLRAYQLGDLTSADVQRLSDGYQAALWREERDDSLEDSFIPEADGGAQREARRPSKVERIKLELRPHRKSRPRGHRAGHDPDKRRFWRRERRLLAA